MRAPFLAVLLAMLVLSGCGGSNGADRPSAETPAATSTTATTSSATTSTATPTTTAAAVGPPIGAMSIVRTANGFTLTGEVPDDTYRASLPDTLRQAMPGAKIVDDLTVEPGVTAPEFAGLGALFGAAVDIRDFGVKLAAGTATLTGTSDTADARSAAETAVKATWPNVVVVNDIGVTSADCAASAADVTGMLKTPITFATGGSALASDSQRLIAQIAERVKACRGVTLAVVGYTDDTGGDAINLPLSVNRAKVVAAALISGGVARADVTSRGAGAADPVAGNDTAEGRAQNRRVELVVG